MPTVSGTALIEEGVAVSFGYSEGHFFGEHLFAPQTPIVTLYILYQPIENEGP